MKYNEKEWKELVLADSRFVDIGGLPSDFIAYPELERRSLYVRPFQLTELKLLSKNIVQQDVKHIIRAVDLVIDMDANRLTVGDFYYILMWLRLHSFPKSPISVRWTCDQPVWRTLDGQNFLAWDKTPDSAEGKKWEQLPCDVQNNEAIHNANLKVLELPDGTELPEGFDFPRVGDLAALGEASKDPEMAMLVKGIQWIKGSWTEKVKLAEGPNGMDLYDTGTALAETIIHGVAEEAVLTCRSCGVKTPYKIRLNAASFFR
jgi:hypothetical protein